MKRREFTNEFLSYIQEGKQVWVISKVKELPKEIITIAKNLADLDFIKYVRISGESLAASSENYPNRPKVPITQMNHDTAVGVHILYSTKYKTVDFFDINSPIKGNGRRMVDAILKDLPKDWHPAVVMDWSAGFWDKMQKRHKKFSWLM